MLTHPFIWQTFLSPSSNPGIVLDSADTKMTVSGLSTPRDSLVSSGQNVDADEMKARFPNHWSVKLRSVPCP